MEDERRRLDLLLNHRKPSIRRYRYSKSWYQNAAEREFFNFWSEKLPDRPFEDTAYDTFSDQIARIESRIYSEIDTDTVPRKKRRYFWNKKTGRVRIVGMKGGKFYRTPKPNPYDDAP